MHPCKKLPSKRNLNIPSWKARPKKSLLVYRKHKRRNTAIPAPSYFLNSSLCSPNQALFAHKYVPKASLSAVFQHNRDHSAKAPVKRLDSLSALNGEGWGRSLSWSVPLKAGRNFKSIPPRHPLSCRYRVRFNIQGISTAFTIENRCYVTMFGVSSKHCPA